jgi:hypothetical protein
MALLASIAAGRTTHMTPYAAVKTTIGSKGSKRFTRTRPAIGGTKTPAMVRTRMASTASEDTSMSHTIGTPASA